MSLAIAKAAPLRPEIRLAQAISDFEANLVEDQKALFRGQRSLLNTPTAQDVGRFTAEVDRNAQRRKSRQCIGPRLARFLQAVQQFSTMVDVAVGGTQSQIGCAVWGVVKFSLQAASISTYFEDLSALIMVISKTSPIHHELALLYPSSVRLQRAFCEYYIAVTQLCTKIITFLGKGIFKQISSTVLNPFKFAFGGLQADLDRLSGIVQIEIALASQKGQQSEAAENSKLRALVSKISDVQSQQLQEKQKRRERKAKTRFLNTCSTYNHVTAWRQARKQGNVSWIMNNDSYITWKNRGGVLWCSGILGSGKTILSANIVDDVRLSTETSVVAIFLCRHDEVESLRYSTIIRSIARQILETAPVSFEDWLGHSLDDDQIIDRLKGLPQPFTKNTYIILDGLDECEKEDREALLGFLRDLHGHVGELHIYCSSRPDIAQQGFLVLQPHWIIPMTETSSEIAVYISNTLKDCQDSGRLRVGDSSILETVYNSLLEHADGMFLWARLQIEDICSQRTDAAILGTLKNLPKGLPNTFNRILQKLSSTQVNSDIQLCRSLFQVISGARRPLTLEELQEALSVDPESLTLDPRRRINDMTGSLGCAGSFLVVDEEDLTVHFAHSSVKQHIHSSSLRLEGSLSTYYTDPAETELRLAEITVTYMKYSGKSQKQVVPFRNRAALWRIDNASLLLDSVSSQHQATTKLLRWGSRVVHKSQGDASDEVGEVYQRMMSGQPMDQKGSYPLLAYASDYWLLHSKGFVFIADHNPAHEEFKRRIRSEIDAETLPWYPERFHDLGQKLMDWVIQAHHWPLIVLIIERWLYGGRKGRYQELRIFQSMLPAKQDRSPSEQNYMGLLGIIWV